jgi:hypothetical protein
MSLAKYLTPISYSERALFFYSFGHAPERRFGEASHYLRYRVLWSCLQTSAKYEA